MMRSLHLLWKILLVFATPSRMTYIKNLRFQKALPKRRNSSSYTISYNADV